MCLVFIARAMPFAKLYVEEPTRGAQNLRLHDRSWRACLDDAAPGAAADDPAVDTRAAGARAIHEL